MTSDARPHRHCLLVDDSELVAELVAADLQDRGWAVTICHSGYEALERVVPVDPDVVVCDLHMPDMDGFEVLRRIGILLPDLPVVILSGDEELSAVLSAVHQGAFDYVLKAGLDQGPLVAAIGRAVRHHDVVKDNRRLSESLRGVNEELARRLKEVDAGNRQLQREIAERLEAQRALAAARDEAMAASRAKSSFLANMSHELRTPLNAIMGYAEILGEDAQELGAEDLVPDLHKIHTAGRHLLELINDILDLSKIEAGKMSVHLEQVSVADLVDEVVETVRPLLNARGNQLDLDMDVDPGVMTTDATRVRQTLLNLLSNAVKFTDRGTVTVAVHRLVSGGRELVRFVVRDTGIGMSAEQLGRLFQDFEQGDSSTTRRYGGTGLGLSISRKLCALLGGTIEADSELGVGSVFTVELPAVSSGADLDARRRDREEAEAVVMRATGARKAVESGEFDLDSTDESVAATGMGSALITDPELRGTGDGIVLIHTDPDVLSVVREALEGRGSRVFSAITASSGLRVVTEQGPRVIVAQLGELGDGLDDFLSEVHEAAPGADLIALEATEPAPALLDRLGTQVLAIHRVSGLRVDLLVSDVEASAGGAPARFDEGID